MATSAELRALKTRYTNLLNDSNAVLNNLNTCDEISKSCSDKLALGLQINENITDDGKIQNMSNSISEMKNKLNNLVIPSLKAKISELNNKIAAAEAAEEAAE